MHYITIFAGWGPCGVLNDAGVTDFYFLTTAAQIIGLCLSGLLLLIANCRFIKKFDAHKRPLPTYTILNVLALLIRVGALYTSVGVLCDYYFGDGNFSTDYDGAIPCDPIDHGILKQATGVALIAIFLIFTQVRRYLQTRRHQKKPLQPHLIKL